MKKQTRHRSLSIETVRVLSNRPLQDVVGGASANPSALGYTCLSCPSASTGGGGGSHPQ